MRLGLSKTLLLLVAIAGASAAHPTAKENPQANADKRFAASYAGRWEIIRPDWGSRTLSNTQSLTITSQTDSEP